MTRGVRVDMRVLARAAARGADHPGDPAGGGDALRGLGVSADCVDDVLVAASEACTNVVQHARASGEYEVTGHVDDGTCLLTITDWGRGRRPPQTGAR